MSTGQPFVSIVVPTRDRPDQLGVCLEHLARLDYPRDRFEVIVVDDGSATAPSEEIERVRDRITVELITQENAGPATARNTGAARARGDLLVFTDDDCAPESQWLASLVSRFVAAPDCAIGGKTVNSLPDNAYSTASQLLIDYLYLHYNCDPQRSRFFTSNNFAVSARLFGSLGGFDAGFPLAAAEDRELCVRWVSKGLRMTYAPEAVVHHKHALTLRGFVRQHFNYGRGVRHLRNAVSKYGPAPSEPLSFYLRLLGYPFSRLSFGRALPLAALFVVTQIASTTGYLFETARRKRNSGE